MSSHKWFRQIYTWYDDFSVVFESGTEVVNYAPFNMTYGNPSFMPRQDYTLTMVRLTTHASFESPDITKNAGGIDPSHQVWGLGYPHFPFTEFHVVYKQTRGGVGGGPTLTTQRGFCLPGQLDGGTETLLYDNTDNQCQFANSSDVLFTELVRHNGWCQSVGSYDFLDDFTWQTEGFDGGEDYQWYASETGNVPEDTYVNTITGVQSPQTVVSTWEGTLPMTVADQLFLSTTTSMEQFQIPDGDPQVCYYGQSMYVLEVQGKVESPARYTTSGSTAPYGRVCTTSH